MTTKWLPNSLTDKQMDKQTSLMLDKVIPMCPNAYAFKSTKYNFLIQWSSNFTFWCLFFIAEGNICRCITQPFNINRTWIKIINSTECLALKSTMYPFDWKQQSQSEAHHTHVKFEKFTRGRSPALHLAKEEDLTWNNSETCLVSSNIQIMVEICNMVTHSLPLIAYNSSNDA